MARSVCFGALCICAAILPFTSNPASADVLFSANFESAANVAGNDTFTDNNIVGNQPVADIGTIDTNDTNSRVNVYGAAVTSPTPAAPNNVVPNAPTSFFPTISYGSQLTRLQGPGTTGTGGGGRFAAALFQPATADTVSFSFDIYASSGVNFGLGSQVPGEFFQRTGLTPTTPVNTRPGQSLSLNLLPAGITILRDADNNPATANTADVIDSDPNVAGVQPLTFTTNTFQHFQLDYVIGTNAITLTQTKISGTSTVTTPVTINSPFGSIADTDFDNTNGLTPAPITSLSQVDTIFFGTGSAGTIGFVDNVVLTGAVPEPAALSLLGLAGLLVARRPTRVRG